MKRRGLPLDSWASWWSERTGLPLSEWPETEERQLEALQQAEQCARRDRAGRVNLPGRRS